MKLVTKFPDDAAKVTTNFLQSRHGIEQAMYVLSAKTMSRLTHRRTMARDEMNEITEDRWDKDIWGVAGPVIGHHQPKLIFYFGTNDHWVADHTRDELIATRGRRPGRDEDWKPVMLIDDESVPHSFCISRSYSLGKAVD